MIRLFEKLREELNRETLKYTYKYQKIHGFNMGTGKEATHNNEADAFKHAFMQVYLKVVYPRTPAKTIGDYHEYIEGWNYDKRENNMDLWNNAIGRKVFDNIKCALGDSYKKYTQEEILNLAAQQICKRMDKGELITNPFTDKRQFKNMELERLKDEDRVFYEDEYWDELDENDRIRYKEHYSNFKNKNNWKLPSKRELQDRVLVGDLIYVKDYTRSDVRKVSGYYRRRPVH